MWSSDQDSESQDDAAFVTLYPSHLEESLGKRGLRSSFLMRRCGRHLQHCSWAERCKLVVVHKSKAVPMTEIFQAKEAVDG